MRPHRDQHYGCHTYSQHGEDVLFLNIFTLLGIKSGRYLDIGAHHPDNISNTKLLYDNGWSGVNVDANPYVMHEFAQQRPRDVNVNCAIGLTAGQTDFYMYSRLSGRNTINPAEVERMKDWATPKESQSVPMMTINQLVQTECGGRFPSLLSLDIEGMDYDVLQSADFIQHGFPDVICVETRIQDTNRMVEMMQGKRYALYNRMGENLLFIDMPLMAKVYGFDP